MTPENERYLWDRLSTANVEGRTSGWTPREVISEMVDLEMIHSAKEAWRTLEKWTDKRFYEFGVCLDLGWKTGLGEICDVCNRIFEANQSKPRMKLDKMMCGACGDRMWRSLNLSYTAFPLRDFRMTEVQEEC